MSNNTPARPLRLDVVIIDAQVDFCHPTGKLFVPGADKDTVRLASFINRVGPKVTMFHATMDSHQADHIAHPISWVGRDGKNPNPFTLISVDDVKNGVWRATDPSRQAHFLAYVESLAANARYVLCIWPEHCLIGSPGHNMMPEVWDALTNWTRTKGRSVNYVTKGSNRETEHYSALMADVPVATDPSTKLNTQFLKALAAADILVITGQAASHCVANTIRDVAANFSPDEVKKFYLLKDCMSAVPGFEKLAEDFYRDMEAQGATIIDDSSKFLV